MNPDFWMKTRIKRAQIHFICVHLWLKSEFQNALLEQMRRSKSNWERLDLDKLYEGFGFIIKHGIRHDIVVHPDFPMLRATLPRHSVLAKGYVEFAIKLVDKLLEFKSKREGEK